MWAKLEKHWVKQNNLTKLHKIQLLSSNLWVAFLKKLWSLNPNNRKIAILSGGG